MPISARLELAAGATAAINDFNPVQAGETIRVWAAGEAADGALTVQIGTKTIFRGRTGIESTANAGPKFDENLVAEWVNPQMLQGQDVSVVNTGAVVVQIQIMKS